MKMTPNQPEFFYLLGLISTLTIIILVFVIIIKSNSVKHLKLTVDYLKNSVDQIDEQAKLIVRTDLELNKVQEELDKKISGLYTLQGLSRNFASTLDEREIFNHIGSEHITELGMQRALGFIWEDKQKQFLQCLAIGYRQEELDNIMGEIASNKDTYLRLIKQGKTLSLRSADNKSISNQEIKRIFKAEDFCFSPIIPKEGAQGFLFLGTTSFETPITEGDEELITILAQSIGQALENARLFETTWRAQQELEKRVELRTLELSKAVNELKNLSKRKSAFVSAVSHELRTPLTSIKGYAAILLSKKLGNIPDSIKERLEKINRHSDELVHMVNDLLDISRIESGRVVMKRESYNLKELMDSVLDLLSVQIKNKNIALSVELSSQFNVVVDKSQIERVFVNLIGNAIKFTPSKGKITLSAKPADNFIQVNISDTGIGIPKEVQEKVFEEFYRVDNPVNETLKGTGLGLSLVKNIIQAHGGSIWVDSQPGVKTTFSFLLPTEATTQTS